jgi:cyclase
MKFTITFITLALLCSCGLAYGQGPTPPATAPISKLPADSIQVRIAHIDDNLYFLDCINGFGGGNVIASIGDEGILLVDDMYAKMSAQLEAAVHSVKEKPIRLILNTHYHKDHIEGNKSFKAKAILVGHENIFNRHKDASPDLAPTILFSDSLTVNFNGEPIRMIHYPNGHTDGDAVIFFSRNHLLHLGDMFFFEMFPAVYTQGGGDIKQLIVNLDKILARFPADTKVVPGHGRLATMHDLTEYVKMLKETTGIVEAGIAAGKTLDEMKSKKLLAKYDALGSGGAQTTDQYLEMLYKLLSLKKS